MLRAEFPALRLASSVVCSGLLWECVCHTMDVSTKGPGADSRRSALPYTAAGHCVEPQPHSQKIQLHQFKHCFVLLALGWLWLIWTSLYHTPIVNPGNTEVLRNKHRVHKMFLNCLHCLVSDFFCFAQAHPSHSNVTDIHSLCGTGNQLEKKPHFGCFPFPNCFPENPNFDWPRLPSRF